MGQCILNILASPLTGEHVYVHVYVLAMWQFILSYIPELHFLLKFAVLNFFIIYLSYFILQIGSEDSMLNSRRVIFPFIVEKMEASLNPCPSPLGSEGAGGCPFPAIVMSSLGS